MNNSIDQLIENQKEMMDMVKDLIPYFLSKDTTAFSARIPFNDKSYDISFSIKEVTETEVTPI